MKRLIEWIKAKTGIRVDEGVINLRLILQQLGRQLELTEQELIQGLISGHIDAKLLINRIVTTESYFFRYHSLMLQMIAQIIQPLIWKGIRPAILSLPCAKGEEPYSLAILLSQVGILAQVKIDACDISSDCIEKAKQGRYNEHALRRMEPSDYQRDFYCRGDFYQIKQHLQQAVNFRCLNILTDMEQLGRYHLIMMHNILIYFTDQNIQHDVLKQIKQHLLPGGWLFVDSVESAIVKREGFCIVPLQENFAFQVSHPASEKLKIKQLPPSGLSQLKPDSIKFHEKKRFEPVTVEQHVSQGLPNQMANGENDKILNNHILQQAAIAKSIYNYPLAIKYYEMLLTQWPDFQAWAYWGLSQIYANQGEFIQALEMVEQSLSCHHNNCCIELNPQQLVDCYLVQALIFRDKGLVNQAKEAFHNIRQLQPSHTILQNDISKSS